MSGNRFCLRDFPNVVYERFQRAWVDKTLNKVVYGLDEPIELQNNQLEPNEPRLSPTLTLDLEDDASSDT